MRIENARWFLHRMLIDRVQWLRPFSPRTIRRRLLFIAEQNAIAQSQLFPFFYHRGSIARFGVEIRELPLQSFQNGNHSYQTHIDAVIFQTSFDLTAGAMVEVATQIQNTWPMARLAYFDWFAPTDLRYAEPLNDRVVLYLKKHVLRDRASYGKTTIGDTNLVDYYSTRYGLSNPLTCFRIPEDFWDKLMIGTHFAFSPQLLTRFCGHFPSTQGRSIDVHARIATKGSEWYGCMRREALELTNALPPRLRVVSQGRVSRKRFLGELSDSKLCFSPFGYGEVCWRDFEAMSMGCLLLKPDMGHIDVYPSVFIPYETYVPLKWDLSDYHEKVEYYHSHESERIAIARNAFDHIKRFFVEGAFTASLSTFLQRLDLLD